MTVQLGDLVRDHYTGFSGVAVGRTDWLYGCSRIHIEPLELREGKTIEAQWFDEQRVEVVERRSPHDATVPRRDPDYSPPQTGGPQKDPTR